MSDLFQLDVADRILSGPIVGTSWGSWPRSLGDGKGSDASSSHRSSSHAAPEGVLPLVTTEHRVRLFSPTERRCIASWGLGAGASKAFTAAAVQQVRSRRLWAVQEGKLLVTWAEGDATAEGGAASRLSSSALCVLTSRFLDPVVVVHRNGSVSLWGAGASKGEASLTWATWGEVHELERRREARVRVC